jgi:hypothetical protein
MKTTRGLTPRVASSVMADWRSLEKARLRTSITAAIRGSGPLGPAGQIDHRGKQAGRQVVDDEPVEVFQRLRGRAPASAPTSR